MICACYRRCTFNSYLKDALYEFQTKSVMTSRLVLSCMG